MGVLRERSLSKRDLKKHQTQALHISSPFSHHREKFGSGKRGRIRAPRPVSVEQDVERSLMEGAIRFLLISVGLTSYPSP